MSKHCCYSYEYRAGGTTTDAGTLQSVNILGRDFYECSLRFRQYLKNSNHSAGHVVSEVKWLGEYQLPELEHD